MLPATERLRLREFVESDAPLLHALDADPEVTRYTLNTQRMLQGYRERIGEYRRQYAETSGQMGYFAAQQQEGGDFVGWFHLRPTNAPKELDLGYRLRRSAWGKGLATEMSRALITYAFTELGSQRVIATALAANAASWRVMEKCGMTCERHFLYEGADKRSHPAVLYAIDRTTLPI
jgi:RimJ/RimL family protein N-acetyltransferase